MGKERWWRRDTRQRVGLWELGCTSRLVVGPGAAVANVLHAATADATTAVPFRARSPGACGVLTAELLGLLYQVGGPVVTAVVLAAVEPTTLSPLSPPPARAVAAPLIAVGEKRPL